MAFQDSGYLITGIKDDSDGDDVIVWTTETDWKNNQAIENISIIGSYFQLGQGTRSTGVIDDFEDNDLSEYAGATGNYQTQSSEVFNGSYALEDTDASSVSEIYSTSGLPRYPHAGDEFEFRVKVTDSGDFWYFNFGWQDGDNNYDLRYEPDVPQIELYEVSGGNFTQLGTSSVTQSTDVWYRVEIDWGEGGTITCTLYDENDSEVAQISATNSTHTEGGIGFKGNNTNTSNTSIYYDYARITDVTDSTGIIDDFEDNDMAEYFGDTSSLQPTTTRPFNGTYSLENPGDNNFYRVSSTSGLPRYPQRGDTFEYRVYLDSLNDHLLSWASTSDITDRYRVYLKLAVDEFQLDAPSSTLGTQSVTWSNYQDTWIRVEVDFQDTVTATAYDENGGEIAQVTGTNVERDGGAISFFQKNKLFTDDLKITASSDFTLAPTGTIEDFEDGDISEYSLDTSDATVQTNTVYNNSNALNINFTADGEARNIVSTEFETSKGRTYTAYVRQEANTNTGFGYIVGVQDETGISGYVPYLNFNGDSAELYKIDNGFTKLGEVTNVGFNLNEWYEAELEWTLSGNLTYTLRNSGGSEVAQISATDTTFERGGIGWRAYDNGNDGSDTYYDFLVSE